jgi:hypothetical protein
MFFFRACCASPEKKQPGFPLQLLGFAYATPPGRGDAVRLKAVRLILQTGGFPRAGP